MVNGNKMEIKEKIIEALEGEYSMRVKIIGKTSYISNKMGGMANKMEDKIHRLPNGNAGIHTYTIKQAMEAGAPLLDIDKNNVKNNLYIIAEANNLVTLKYKTIVPLENNGGCCKGCCIGKIKSISRPRFNDWSCEFTIKHTKKITTTQIINLLKITGFHIGLGWNKPLTDGPYGSFTVKLL